MVLRILNVIFLFYLLRLGFSHLLSLQFLISLLVFFLSCLHILFEGSVEIFGQIFGERTEFFVLRIFEVDVCVSDIVAFIYSSLFLLDF